MCYNALVQDKAVILELSGTVHVQDIADLKQILAQYVAEGKHSVILQLENVTYMDCSGLGFFVSAHKFLQAVHGALMLSGARGIVRDLLRITKLDTVLLLEEEDLLQRRPGGREVLA